MKTLLELHPGARVVGPPALQREHDLGNEYEFQFSHIELEAIVRTSSGV